MKWGGAGAPSVTRQGSSFSRASYFSCQWCFFFYRRGHRWDSGSSLGLSLFFSPAKGVFFCQKPLDISVLGNRRNFMESMEFREFHEISMANSTAISVANGRFPGLHRRHEIPWREPWNATEFHGVPRFSVEYSMESHGIDK